MKALQNTVNLKLHDNNEEMIHTLSHGRIHMQNLNSSGLGTSKIDNDIRKKTQVLQPVLSATSLPIVIVA